MCLGCAAVALLTSPLSLSLCVVRRLLPEPLTHVCVVWVPAQTREMLHGHRVRLVDAFRVFDSNNRGWLDETSAPHPHQTHWLAPRLELDS